MSRARVIDCFKFFDELELLEIRLNELDDVVDYFVIAEATRTHTGADRELTFDIDDPRWRKFKDRIIYVVVDDMPDAEDHWVRENFQRNALMRGIDQIPVREDGPDDIVLIGDADEMPRASAVRLLHQYQWSDVVHFEMSYFNYHLNQRGYAGSTFPHGWPGLDTDRNAPYPWVKWRRAGAVRRSAIDTPEGVRTRLIPQPGNPLITDAGWHFSYMGGIDRMRRKLASAAHQEINIPEVTDPGVLERAIEEGRDHVSVDDRWRFVTVPLDAHLPKYVLENRERFADLIKDHSERRVTSRRIFIDVGAHLGQQSIPAAESGLFQIHAFEPAPLPYAFLKQHEARLPDLHVHQKAVSNFHGMAKLNFSGQGELGTSSLFQWTDEFLNDVHPELAYDNSGDTEVIRLDAFLTEQGIDRIDYLHVDAQGNDVEVLEGLGNQLDNVICGDFETAYDHALKTYKEQRKTLIDAVAFLYDRGFLVTRIFSNDAGGQVIENQTPIDRSNEVNVFFVNKRRRQEFETLKDELKGTALHDFLQHHEFWSD